MSKKYSVAKFADFVHMHACMQLYYAWKLLESKMETVSACNTTYYDMALKNPAF